MGDELKVTGQKYYQPSSRPFEAPLQIERRSSQDSTHFTMSLNTHQEPSAAPTYLSFYVKFQGFILIRCLLFISKTGTSHWEGKSVLTN